MEYVLHKRQIDVLLLNEKFLRKHHKFKLGGYLIYREYRHTHGGGVLIAIKGDIRHMLLPKTKTSTVESISIGIMINRRLVIFTSAYNPTVTASFKADLN